MDAMHSLDLEESTDLTHSFARRIVSAENGKAVPLGFYLRRLDPGYTAHSMHIPRSLLQACMSRFLGRVDVAQAATYTARISQASARDRKNNHTEASIRCGAMNLDILRIY
jgi:hypothetical protein